MDWQALTLFLYIIARVSGFVLFNPLLSRSNLPTLFRAGLILTLSLFMLSVEGQTVAVPGSILVFSIRVLLELFVGYALGLVVNFFLYIPQMAGQVIDTQMGLTMNQIYDAGSQSNLSVTALFLNILMVLLFFAENGHHTLLRILLTSGDVVPFGAVSMNVPVVVSAILELFIECTVLSVKLCMPILAAELIGQLGMGILMKAIPQINVFAINIELKVIIGLALLLLLIAPFSEFFLETEILMLNRLEGLWQLAKP